MTRSRQRFAWSFSCLALALVLAAPAPAPARAADETVALFNGKDLSGWYVYIPHKDKSDPKADPKGVFKVEDGLIHVSGEEFGCLTTDKEFENYRLVVEFKWGDKKWPPRDKPSTPRDSGILLHCVGPDKVWTKSIECQVQEHDCGDFYLVSGTTLRVDGKVEKGSKKKTKDAEKPTGEWNTIECVCDGGKITNIVNGVVVNEGDQASVTKGKILLQSEGAEIYFRKVELTSLKK